ncbi:TonB-dependent receptor domain-containing protein [Mucilaginibacter sp.]|uniref:TonB-dependent receptor n=1 Tax=Mucilaginibacter sp. TaxID=1882438 RepID=UPI00284BAC56|nr:TonB-dependent receptor [Mucilaginibacter sp.]MDR3696350.1 TonB-dependent receptor [Mucilaginibacter sp.]
MKIFYTLIIMLLSASLVTAQNSPVKPISVNFQQAGTEQFVKDLELKTGYHFYYNSTQFDSLKVTLQLSDKTLNEILNAAFRNTGYHYTIVPAKLWVFLTSDKEIHPLVAAGYFTPKPGQVTINNTAPVTDLTATVNKPAIESTIENKLYEIGIKTNEVKPGNATISGYVKEIKSGDVIAGASIFVANTKTGVVSDKFGYYTLSLPRGRQQLIVRAIGMKDTRRQLMLYTDGELNIELQDQVTRLKEVKISADKVANVRGVELSVNRLDIKNIKQVPQIFGETDVLRVVLTLPGVQSVGEATTGFNVRGGAADQNLILLNDATIYNPAHFFGFFSAFNPDIVKDVELYKNSIPEKFGGRLSSVLEVTDREGNKKSFAGSAGIGLLTSRLNVEGPIIKDKTSFIFGARTSYSDWLLSLLPAEYKHSHASFYDLNLDISHQINKNNNIYITSYLSNDNFRLNSDTTYNYSNQNANIKWKHNFNNKFFGVLTAGYDGYKYDISSIQNPVDGYKLKFNINQTNFKADFTYYLNGNNTIDFGISSIFYQLNPGDEEPYGNGSLVVPDVVPAEHALESAVYLGDKYDMTDDLTISAGMRFSVYNYLGQQTIDNYAPNLPRSPNNVVDSTTYGKGKIINTYSHPEIRISARYNLSDDLSIKAGYNTLAQYIHLLSNTTAISPIDVYKLSDPNIKPQYGDQISLGLYKNAKANTIEASVEVYYKRINNYLDYKSSASLLLNQHIEQDVLNTQGKAYGIEFSLRKTAGKLNGWVNYTYSRTFLRQNDPNAGELINGGAYYPANYDKPNAFNFTGNYRFTHRYSVSLDVTYSTGRPITLPIAKYYAYGSERVFYSDRNAYRIPDYFRSDFSLNIDGNAKVNQRFHNSWSVGVYNLTGRQNAYSTFFQEQGGAINEYQLSIFARPIPFINYNIRF